MRVRVWYAAVMVVLAAAFVSVPAGRFGLVVAIGLLGAATIEWGVRRWRPERSTAWRLLAVAVVVLGGHLLLLLLEGEYAVQSRYPAGSDLVAVVGFFALSVAVFWLGRPRTPEREETSLIDAVSLTLAVSLIVWVTLVRPALDGHLGMAQRLTAILALLGCVAVLAAAVRLALGWRRNAAVIVLVVALGGFLVSEAFHGHLVVRAVDGGLTDFGFVALAAGGGAAALSRSMRDVASPASGRHSLRPWRLALIGAALLVAPAALVIESAAHFVRTDFAIATGGALVSAFVLVRLSMSGHAYRARAARERAALAASQAMVSAVTASDVLAGARNAVGSLTPVHGAIGLDLVARHDTEHAPRTVVPVGARRSGELVVPLSGSESALVFTAPQRVLLELADLLESLADQAAVAFQRISLAEIAGAQERDRYFRTLVLTSTDAILISRDGHIEYATPSAQTMFGRDVVDEDFDEIVRRADAGDAGRQWPKSIDAVEGVISRPGGDATVLIQRRDLTLDPTVRGTVTTLRDVTAERELQHDLAYRASHDELTGMINTRAWSETVASEKDRRRGPGNGTAVIFIDLDDFKQINDRHGHPTGDRVLADVARRIRSCVRAGDVAARVGGDEFAVLMRSLPDIDDARSAAQRLAETLSRPTVVDSDQIDSKATIGLAYTEGQERIDTLVRQADTALYAAKEQGKGRWTEYNPEQWAPSRSVHNGTLHDLDPTR